MKFKLLVLSVLGSITLANAQYTVTDDNGVVLNDGDVIEYGTLAYPDASYDFFVTNDNPTDEIYTRVQLVSATNNSDATFEQLCYGDLCYFDVEMLQFVPPMNASPVAIPVGRTTGMGNHFYNNDPGNSADPVDFVFSFRQYQDADGTVEIGTPLTFTYRYNPSLGVETNNSINLTIQSTVVSDQLVLTVNEPVQMWLYDLQGKLVKRAAFESGNQVVNVSDLSAQIYIAQFENTEGGKMATKILIK